MSARERIALQQMQMPSRLERSELEAKKTSSNVSLTEAVISFSICFAVSSRKTTLLYYQVALITLCSLERRARSEMKVKEAERTPSRTSP